MPTKHDAQTACISSTSHQPPSMITLHTRNIRRDVLVWPGTYSSVVATCAMTGIPLQGRYRAGMVCSSPTSSSFSCATFSKASFSLSRRGTALAGAVCLSTIEPEARSIMRLANNTWLAAWWCPPAGPRSASTCACCHAFVYAGRVESWRWLDVVSLARGLLRHSVWPPYLDGSRGRCLRAVGANTSTLLEEGENW